MLPSQWPLKRQSPEIFAANDRVTLRFIDAERSFLPNAALARNDEHFDVDPLAEGGRACGLFCVRWTILMWKLAPGRM